MEISWMLGLLAFLLVECIVIWGARSLLAAWNVGEPVSTTVYVLLVVIFAVAILMRLAGVGTLIVR